MAVPIENVDLDGQWITVDRTASESGGRRDIRTDFKDERRPLQDRRQAMSVVLAVALALRSGGLAARRDGSIPMARPALLLTTSNVLR